VDWIELPQDGVQQQDPVSTALYRLVPLK